MPLPAGPDRTKGKIASVIFERMAPSFANRMRMASEQNLSSMNDVEEKSEESNEESVQAGSLALRALYSAMQGGDFEAAYRAYYSLHLICDAQIERNGDEPGESEEGGY